MSLKYLISHIYGALPACKALCWMHGSVPGRANVQSCVTPSYQGASIRFKPEKRPEVVAEHRWGLWWETTDRPVLSRGQWQEKGEVKTERQVQERPGWPHPEAGKVPREAFHLDGLEP